MMAYSGYGGYAYGNGKRIEERSDACFTTTGIASTPGLWPGWSIPEGRGGGSYHALLGDGPVHVGLYKQSSVTVWVNNEEMSLAELAKNKYPDAIETYEGEMYLDTDYFLDDSTAIFEINNHKIELFWTDTDNFYVYARLTQPDGVIWTGFSGYGVGAGLENAGYGYSTSDVEDDMFEHWRKE